MIALVQHHLWPQMPLCWHQVLGMAMYYPQHVQGILHQAQHVYSLVLTVLMEQVHTASHVQKALYVLVDIVSGHCQGIGCLLKLQMHHL